MLPHLAAIVIFIIISAAFFSKLFSGYELRQGDIEKYIGMSKEINDFSMANDGADALWTNSMFGGMPAYQIAVQHPGNFMRHVNNVMMLGLPRPVGILFMAMLGFYILCLCLRVNPWLGILGGVSFGLASINILFLGAGHNSKVHAIAYMAPAIGGMLLALRGNRLRGAAVFALFFSLHLYANHLQMTYYLVIMLVVIALGEFVAAIIQKRLPQFAKASGMLAVAGIVAMLPSASNLVATQEYSHYTTRGKTELTKGPDGNPITATGKDGLETDYILEYNFGSAEWMSMFLPNVKGGLATERLAVEKKAMAAATAAIRESAKNPESLFANLQAEQKNELIKSAVNNTGSMSHYWGGQGFTAGAFYFGAAIMILFVLALFFAKDVLRWPALVLTVLAIILCSNNPVGVNGFFIDHFPLYNKFRDSKMILVMVQVLAPLMAVLFLQRIVSGGEKPLNRTWFLAITGGLMLICILFAAAPKSLFAFQSAEEKKQFSEMMDDDKMKAEDLEFASIVIDGMTAARVEIFSADALRTLLLAAATLVLLALALFTKVHKTVLISVLAVLAMADQFAVDKRYHNAETVRGVSRHYVKPDEKFLPFTPNAADNFILMTEKVQLKNFDETKNKLLTEMKKGHFKSVRRKELLEPIAGFGALGLNSNYRVLKLTSLTQDAGTSYFHKSLGGYHGAKLKRYDELIKHRLNGEIATFSENANALGLVEALKKMPVANMLNAKYIIYSDSVPPLMNFSACGNAWFVDELVVAKSADEELAALKTLDPKTTCILRDRDAVKLQKPTSVDSTRSITLDEYKPNHLKYTSKNSAAGPAVFSEIFYPEGWKCLVDGKEKEYVCVNYVLRGVQLPAGEHSVEWIFDPAGYKSGTAVSYCGSTLLLLFSFGVLGMQSFREFRSLHVVS